MRAEQLLYAVGDIREDFIREAAPESAAARRRSWPWAAALAACLCLVLLIARTRPAAPMGSEAPGDAPPADAAEPGAPPPPNGSGEEDLPAGCPLFPGEIAQPLLYWQGTAYAWDRVGAAGRLAGEPPEAIGQWTELGPLAGATAEETREDLWLYADIGPVSGTVYADPEGHPGVLYVLMTTEWFEEQWVRFVADERLLMPVFFYGGQLYYLDPCYPPRNAVSELPEGYGPAGMLVFPSDHDFDRLPHRDLVITLCPEYPGNTLYVDPDRNGILYVEYQKHWSGGCETLYVPAAPTPQPWQRTAGDAAERREPSHGRGTALICHHRYPGGLHPGGRAGRCLVPAAGPAVGRWPCGVFCAGIADCQGLALSHVQPARGKRRPGGERTAHGKRPLRRQ